MKNIPGEKSINQSNLSNFNRSVGLEMVAAVLDDKNIAKPLRSVITNGLDVDRLIMRKSGMKLIEYHTICIGEHTVRRTRESKD